MQFQISTILRIKEEPCGISLFDKQLRHTLLNIGIESEKLDIETFKPNDSNVYIFHYVPSLYVKNTQAIDSFLSKTIALKVVIIHGMLPNHSFQYCADTICPDFIQQLNIIINYSDIIIGLSKSTINFLESWMENGLINKIHTLYHPGLDKSYLLSNSDIIEPYIFLGGITRPKKDFNSTIYLKLIHKLHHLGIKIWLHSTPNTPYDASISSVWKFTTNELNFQKWSEAIANASWVLCPYDTKIQTVSGIIAESISVGRKVLTTSFPYSVEISKQYKNLIIVEDDLKIWPEIILDHPYNPSPLPSYPTWDNFILDLMNIVQNHNRY